MPSDNLRDIQAFLAIAQERSFTRAAAKLGVSQSALSHTLRSLESRLGLRLLTRTTRSVSPTEAGERLIASVAPRFEAIREELVSFEELRDKPAGTVCINASEFAITTMLWPKLSELQPKYPDVKIELSIDPGVGEVAVEGFDAGVRFGDQIARGMIAVRISSDVRMAVGRNAKVVPSSRSARAMSYGALQAMLTIAKCKCVGGGVKKGHCDIFIEKRSESL